MEQIFQNKELMEKLNIISIPLTESESRVIEDLHQKYSGFPNELFLSIEGLFCQTKILLTAVAEGAEGELCEGTLALLGILNRTHELLQGGIRQITFSNRHVWGACFRGLIETYGAITWVNEKPANLPSLVQNEGPKVSRFKNVAYNKIDGLSNSYKKLSSLVHPQSKSLLLGMIPISDEQMSTLFAVPAPELTEKEANSCLEDLIGICVLIHKEIKLLIDSHPEALKSGKLVGRIQWKGKPSDCK